MNLKEIETLIKEQIYALDNTLSDWREGSVLTTITRGIAAANYKQYTDMYNLSKNSSIETAKGDNLDNIGKTFGIHRLPGAKAKGSVLLVSYSKQPTLQKGSVFTEPVSGRQYETLQDVDLSRGSLIERKVKVEALEEGVEYNLTTGTRLISGKYPELMITVGSHRTAKGELCGAIVGGVSLENDAEYRKRVVDTLLYSRHSNESSIKSALMADDLINWVIVETPRPGYCRVWVDSEHTLVDSLLDKYLDIVKERVCAGILVDVLPLTRKYVDVSLRVFSLTGVDLDDLGITIKVLLNSYLQKLPIGGQVDLTQNMAIVLLDSLRKKVQKIEVVEPTEVIELQESEVIRLGTLSIQYSI